MIRVTDRTSRTEDQADPFSRDQGIGSPSQHVSKK
jgi:hypothetical protein